MVSIESSFEGGHPRGHPAYVPSRPPLVVLGSNPLTYWATTIHAVVLVVAVALFVLIEGVAAGAPVLFLLILWGACALSQYFCPIVLAVEPDALVLVRQGWFWPTCTTIRLLLADIVSVLPADGRGLLIRTRTGKRYPVHFTTGRRDAVTRFSLYANATQTEFPADMNPEGTIAAFCDVLRAQNMTVSTD